MEIKTEETNNSEKRYRMYLVLIILLMLALHLFFISRHSVFTLEFITYRSIQLDYPDLIEERIGMNHMPGYFVFLKAWTEALGDSEAMLRMPSAIGSILAILAVWRIGVLLLGRRKGLLVFLLISLHQLGIEVGYDARMYAWVFAASSYVLWGVLGFWESGRKGYLLMIFLAGLLGITSHMLYLIVPLVIAVYAALNVKRLGKRGWGALAAAVFPAMLFMPVVVWWTKEQDKVGKSPWHALELSKGLRQIKQIFLGDYHFLDQDVVQGFGFLALGACVYATFAFARRLRKGSTEPTDNLPLVWKYSGLLWMWALLPGAGIILVAVKSHHQFVGGLRYYIMSLSVAPVLLVAGWEAFRRMGRRRVAKGYMAIVLVVVGLNTLAYIASPGSGLREVVLEIGKGFQEGDVVLTSEEHPRSQAFKYYLGFEEIPAGMLDKHWTMEVIEPWFVEQTEGYKRVWVVFYDDDFEEDALARFLKLHTDRYPALREVYHYGESHVGLYDLPE